VSDCDITSKQQSLLVKLRQARDETHKIEHKKTEKEDGKRDCDIDSMGKCFFCLVYILSN
jgi:hypothetical protein